MTKKLFLLRGLIRESRHWGDMPLLIEKAIDDIEVITPNLPGVGPYHRQTSPNNFDDMIHFIRRQHQDKIGQGGHCLLAMSLGGMLAKRWTELYPQDFTKLILVNTSFKGLNPLFQRLQPISLWHFLKLFFIKDIQKRELGIIQMVSNKTEHHAKVHRLCTHIQADAPVSRQSFINQVKAALFFKPNLTPPSAKLMILAGEKDRLCHVQCSNKIHELWGGELHLHPDAGHDLPIDDPDWFLKHVKNFLEQKQ